MKKMIVAALSLALLISALALCACGKTPVEAGREKSISAANKIANNPNVPKRDAGTYEEKLGKYSVSSVFGADGKADRSDVHDAFFREYDKLQICL